MLRLLLLSLACLLAACGQKGALYLPTPPAVPAVPQAMPEAAPVPVPAAQESTEKDTKDAKDTPATAPRP